MAQTGHRLVASLLDALPLMCPIRRRRNGKNAVTFAALLCWQAISNQFAEQLCRNYNRLASCT